MPNLKKSGGTRALQALQYAQQGLQFGDSLANSRVDRANAIDANRRANALEELVHEQMRAETTGQKGRNATTAEDLSYKQRTARDRAEAVSLGNRSTEQSIANAKQVNDTREELRPSNLARSEATTSTAQSQATSSRVAANRDVATADANIAIDRLTAQQQMEAAEVELAMTQHERMELTRTLKRKDIEARVAYQNAIFAEDSAKDGIANAQMAMLQDANIKLAGLAKHNPKLALEFAKLSSQFGIGDEATSVEITDDGYVQILDDNGNVVDDSVQEGPAAYDMGELYEQATAKSKLDAREQQAKIDKTEAEAAKLRGRGEGRDLTQSQIRQNDNVHKITKELIDPEASDFNSQWAESLQPLMAQFVEMNPNKHTSSASDVAAVAYEAAIAQLASQAYTQQNPGKNVDWRFMLRYADEQGVSIKEILNQLVPPSK